LLFAPGRKKHKHLIIENKMNKKIAAILITVVLALLGFTQQNNNTTATSNTENKKSSITIEQAYKNKLSDIQFKGDGKVIRVLADDNEGHRHQKFILRLDSKKTILIAHNIDLAPRIKNLRKGDTVQFYGEYEWSERGGVIHWTHHDPRGKHIGGWLKHKGKIYQ